LKLGEEDKMFDEDDEDFDEAENTDIQEEDDDDDDDQVVNHCAKTTCFNCNQTIPMSGYCRTSVEKRRKKDHEMRDFVYGMLFEDMRSLKCGCKKYNGKCIGLAGIDAIGELRDNFWGSKFDETIRTKEKGKKLESLLRQFYDAPNDKFNYTVGKLNVCDKGFFMLLGLFNKSSQKIGSQLRRIMNIVRNKLPLLVDEDEEMKQLKKDKNPRTKPNRHAVSFRINTCTLHTYISFLLKLI